MKKLVSVLLLVGLCFGGATVQAEEQVNWWNKPFEDVLHAAEQGDAVAQYDLGLMYITGKGVTQDYRQAFAWTRKAAEQGYSAAQYTLAVMYGSGKGVAQDYKLAYVWSSVTFANGIHEASVERDILAKKLTPEDLADAQTLAGDYFEKYQPKS